jgi:hypothetical protein
MSTHGIPKQIVTDSGSEFTSSIFEDFCKQYNIDHHTTSKQNSTSNSPVERVHSTLTEIYRIIYHLHKNKDHEDILNEVILTYNNAIHSATELTPFEVFYGRTYKFTNTVQHRTVHEYLEKLNEFQNELFPQIKSMLDNKVYKTLNKLNEKRDNPEQFDVNTTIFQKENRRSKLARKFTKQKVKKDGLVTLITQNNTKLHKSKIKKKRKFQVSTGNDRTEDGNT